MLRRPLVVLVSAGLLVTAGACAPASLPIEVGPAPTATASQAPIDVDGRPGQVPELKYAKPFDVLEPGSRTVWPGTGEPLERDGSVLLNLYAEDGRDGSELQNTYRSAPASYTMTESSLGNHLFEALRGKRAGARVMLLESDSDEGAEVPVVLVVDVLPTRASGTELPGPPGGLPRVTRDELGAPTVRIPRDAEPPRDLEVVPLVRGRGPQVAQGQVVTFEVHAVAWGSGEVVETTWAKDSPPRSAQVGIGALIEGWDTGLVQQPVGSQVMLVAPPGMAYAGTKSPLAGETLVYVIDILDAHKPMSENEKKRD
ncbi:FKBP-type peptidyl-prolyl cis-trans isomerase [Myceligenerans pegani]|uniref:FKBP-type peptidyl-prolyl cis-trans isomerase n=1 Tax=Myceligenerans pegani TaxID=2776917 RepID=UPI00299DBAD3|nr:FKBP-type peptidyl-prolyl cis-trans isomerase [Myceligenerans sp. TRM 65318]